MVVETAPQKGIFTRAKERAQNSLLHVKRKYLDPRLLAFSERAFQLIDKTPGSDDNISEFIELANAGYVPIIIGNHQSYTDGIIASEIAHEVVEETDIPEFKIMIAHSMMDGKQGIGAFLTYHIFETLLNAKHTVSVGTVRAKDVKSIDPVKGVYSDAEAKELQSKFGGEMRRVMRRKLGWISLPAGTMEEGRINKETGERWGMRRAEQGLNDLFLMYLRRGIRFAVLPMTVDETYRIGNPTTKLWTLEACFETLKEKLTGNDPKKLAKATFGKPITDENIVRAIELMTDRESEGSLEDRIGEDGNRMIDFIMEVIASRLRKNMRGVYGDELDYVSPAVDSK